MPEHEQWFYVKDGHKHGPIAWDELRRLAREGQLTPTDMVLRAGEQKWAAGADVDGLFVPDGASPATISERPAALQPETGAGKAPRAT